MPTRSPELRRFLHTLEKAILDVATVDGDAHRLTEKVMSALRDEQTTTAAAPARLPVCSLLEGAIDRVRVFAPDEAQDRTGSVRGSVAEHARAMHALVPQLVWWQRPEAAKVGEPFASGHANATIIGLGGLEERDDVWVGISLIAPGVEYPEHRHPPEEVYLVLSPGDWQQSGGPWFEPGIGALVYNRANILHAMRSGSQALLATWCLWAG